MQFEDMIFFYLESAGLMYINYFFWFENAWMNAAVMSHCTEFQPWSAARIITICIVDHCMTGDQVSKIWFLPFVDCHGHRTLLWISWQIRWDIFLLLKPKLMRSLSYQVCMVWDPNSRSSLQVYSVQLASLSKILLERGLWLQFQKKDCRHYILILMPLQLVDGGCSQPFA